MDSNKIIEVKLRPGIKYFTVPEIIKEASRIFCFEAPKSYDGGRLYKTIARQIGRKLHDKKSYGEGSRNKKYSRNDVQHLLQIDLYDYFIKVSQKQNEKRYNANIGKGNPKEGTWKKNLERVADSTEARESLVETYIEQTEKWMAYNADYLSRRREGKLTREEIEQEIEFDVEEKKKKIFFEFLYQSFFDILFYFDETLFREDIKHRIEGDDYPENPTQAEATSRLQNDRNYYNLKVSLDKMQELLKKLKVDQPPE